MTNQEELINLYKEALESKKQALDEARLKLIEANVVIYEISKLIENKQLRDLIYNYLNKIK